MRNRPWPVVPVLLALAATVAVVLGPAPGRSVGAAREPVGSLLIISVPATSWGDIRDGRPPNLAQLFRASALADLSTRTVRNRSTAGPGYLAFGTGARSVLGGDDGGINLEPHERYAGTRASAVFETRTGLTLTRGVGALGWAQIVAQNENRSYGAEPGTLGRALTKAGIGRRVIANGDVLTTTGLTSHREAALALVDDHGRVPGQVTELTTTDPTAPYGLRLDADAVVRAFPGDFSSRRQVVLVEASDLARADSYRPMATPDQRSALRTTALRRSDRLVGRLLERVDLERDAVMVVSPYHTSRARTLTVAAVHAPGIDAGVMESATTRRAGFLQVVDLAPTVLDLLGVDRPAAIEGRPARYHRADGDYVSRVNSLVRADRAAQFRDATIGKTTATLVTATITLVALALLWYRFARNSPARVALRWASLALLGYVTSTFVVGVFPTFRWGTGAYFVIVTTLTLAFAAVCQLLGRRRPEDPILIALGLIIVVHVGDLVSGATLQLNTVFGYTATVGIRIAGIGNPGSAQLSAATVLFAALLAWRFPVRGAAVGSLVLAAVLVVIGAPLWGQDYGGALALGPTTVLWWMLSSGRQVRVRTAVTMAAVLIATGLAAGLLDLSRPGDERTHVGRFFERVGAEGVGGFFGVIGRKTSLMLGTFSNTAWVLLVASVLGVLWLAARRTGVLAGITERIPPLREGLLCFAVLTVLGTALNDSGVQVTGMLLATLLPVLVFFATYDDPNVVDATSPPPVHVPA